MRDIKFRAYDKFNKVMTYSDKNYPLSKYSIEFNWKNNNKMSLLMLIDPRCGEMREYDAVYFRNGEYRVADFRLNHVCSRSEVIGNIYEDEDLLKNRGY